MIDLINKIKDMIKLDHTEEAIEMMLAQLSGKDQEIEMDLMNHKAVLANSRRGCHSFLKSIEEDARTRSMIRIAVLAVLAKAEEKVRDEEKAKAEKKKADDGPVESPLVFISYNHGDSIIANQLKTVLRDHGVAVKIDSETMEPGGNISDFIENAIRETDITLSIISNSSLLSAWVAMETILSFYRTKFEGSKKLIGCFIDDDFFQPGFHLEAIEKIDEQINELDRKIIRSIEKKYDPVDLNSTKTRLYRLRNNMGDILLNFRECLCLDIRVETFGQSMDKLIQVIKP